MSNSTMRGSARNIRHTALIIRYKCFLVPRRLVTEACDQRITAEFPDHQADLRLIDRKNPERDIVEQLHQSSHRSRS